MLNIDIFPAPPDGGISGAMPNHADATPQRDARTKRWPFIAGIQDVDVGVTFELADV